ncbi:hypothetical protein MRB53_034791 [Persea americana]|uniref:Uncharacterized protein n=1 Tax=Persea americana TaxID=3435 RepID=A0ACC2K334_PERAE|nr:hypothetical protein MRB53_034791 [Persea americana]
MAQRQVSVGLRRGGNGGNPPSPTTRSSVMLAENKKPNSISETRVFELQNCCGRSEKEIELISGKQRPGAARNSDLLHFKFCNRAS